MSDFDRIPEKQRDLLDAAMDNFDIDRMAMVLEEMYEDASEIGDLAVTIKRYAQGDVVAQRELGAMFYGLVREYVGRIEATEDRAEASLRYEDEGRRTRTPPHEWP